MLQALQGSRAFLWCAPFMIPQPGSEVHNRNTSLDGSPATGRQGISSGQAAGGVGVGVDDLQAYSTHGAQGRFFLHALEECGFLWICFTYWRFNLQAEKVLDCDSTSVIAGRISVGSSGVDPSVPVKHTYLYTFTYIHTYMYVGNRTSSYLPIWQRGFAERLKIWRWRSRW